MSELNMQNRRGDLRRQFLTTVSALALIGFVSVRDARAASDDANRPILWIELGGQLERKDVNEAIFEPPFFGQGTLVERNIMTDAQRSSLYHIGEEGAVFFEPEGTGWVFSANFLYGRGNSAAHLHYHGPKNPPAYFTLHGHPFVTHSFPFVAFSDGQTGSDDTHLIVDFKAGKDVGLGLFGTSGSSVFSAGVRFAQFTSRNDVTLHLRPPVDITIKSVPGKYKFYFEATHSFAGVLQAQRSTHAVGPLLTWNASANVAGTDNEAELAVDWGVNAAVLFGRQRAKIHHQTSGYFNTGFGDNRVSHYSINRPTNIRSKTVVIPNLGGFAGLSLKFPNATISLGYRADFFFGAMDGGIDTAKKENVGFYGPFASVSVGIGG